MSCVRNANITAATQICHRDTSSANANITAATQICRRDTSSANANITAAAQICHRDTSSANANISAATQITRTDTSSANANITAAGETYLSNRHLLCKRQYNCGNTDLSHRHLFCKRQYNCGDKKSRGHGGDYPRRSSFRKLCVLHLPRKSKPRPWRRLSAPQLLQEALRTAPATQKRAAATAATIRAAAPSGSSAYCTCHAKASRGHGGDFRAAAPSGSSAYCTCHAKASRGHGGDYPRRSSLRKLCVLHLPRTRPWRRLSAPQLLQEALRTAPATQKRAAATAATIRAAAPSGSSACCA